MEGRRHIFLSICLFVASSHTESSAAEETCEEIQTYKDSYSHYGYTYLWQVWSYFDSQVWHNMTFWGGHSQIPTKDDIDYKCFASWTTGLIVLIEKHPNTVNIDDDVVTLEACSLDRNGVCEWNTDVEMRKCNGDLLYSFPGYDHNNDDWWNQYICLDRIYTDTCSDTSLLYSAGNVDGQIIQISNGDFQTGWYNGFVNGKQYVVPSAEDLENLFDKCSNDWVLILQEPIPMTIQEAPVRLFYCFAYENLYNDYFTDDSSHYITTDDEGNCYDYIYVRACNGKLQFDLSYMINSGSNDLCLIHENNVIVKPEIRHDITYTEIGGESRKEYSPFLQYRCSFDMSKGVSYKTNWYINGTLMAQRGPSSQLDDLVFKDESLNYLLPGYEVQCGVIAVSENQYNETLSDVFYAGWKVSASSISLSKSGSAFLELEQTIPHGCFYTDNETPQCSDELSFVDHSSVPDVCAGSIRVQDAKDASKSYIEIKSLEEGEKWTSKTYRARFTTIDSDYNDRAEFDLDLSVTRRTGRLSRRAITTEIVGAVHVDVTDNNRHWNKRCYSHVDPHHKTTDGQHIEMQIPDDHMLFKNEAYESEIQQSARYCSTRWPGGPVCACGIAIRVGADAFVINRCPDSSFTFDFIQCGDGGLIDIERIHDYRYLVRTPTGTIVDISLHTWGSTMNIDIYMSAKDFGNVVGLCGYFDGDRSNDLLHRDGVTVSHDNNRDYRFSDSWKLTDAENLFKNENRYLKPWNVANGAGGPGHTCSRPNSITRTKCKVPRRRKRSLPNKHGNELEKQYQTLFPLSRIKRSSENFTENEAFQICNQSIYMTPAVVEFRDKLAEEDPDKVVEQCVYDLTQGNDMIWVDAHTAVLNNAADSILRLNPVFVANNSDIVNAFRSQTCLNNCSQNGACTETGMCECNGVYRGPDCSIDIRIPPVIFEVQGGDICHTGDGDDCTCFQIRTDNIFDGFMCNMTKYKVNLNGTRIRENGSIFEGDYQDIFTGVCCHPGERKNSYNDDNGIMVTIYEFTVSNDGNNYGEPNFVYAYDVTCIEQDDISGIITFELKDEFCFIDGACVMSNNKVLTTDECYICDPTVNQYNWTKGYCDETESTGLTTATLVGIIIGACIGVTVIGVLIYLLCFKGPKKPRKVQVSHTNLRSALASTRESEVSKPEDKSTTLDNSKLFTITPNEPDLATFLPDINLTDAPKPVCKRSMWTPSQSFPNIESSVAETMDGQYSDSETNMDIDRSITDLGNDRGVTTISVKSLEIFY